MTDEESRKALDAWLQATTQLSVPVRAGDGVMEVWQAAVEWATERERERCAQMLAEMLVDEDMNVQISFGKLLDAIQEPKP